MKVSVLILVLTRLSNPLQQVGGRTQSWNAEVAEITAIGANFFWQAVSKVLKPKSETAHSTLQC